MIVRRGDVWLIDFGEPVGREQSGRRPAIVISANAMNEVPSGLVVVVPLTSTRRGLPSHVELDHPDTGLDTISYAKCEDVKSMSERRLITRLGIIPGINLIEIERNLRYLLDL